MIEVEILHGRARLTELKPDWDRLLDRGEYEPSVSFEWVAALMESHVRESDEVAFIVLKRAGTVIGIVPLVLRALKRLGQPFIMAFPISEFTYTHSDLLIEDFSEPVLATFLDALYRRELRWDAFSMTRLLEARPLGARLHDLVRRRRKRFVFEKERPSFVLTLDSTFSGYLSRRSGSFRSALKRIERKLSSRGRVEVRSQHDFADIHQAYETLLSIEERSWKQPHGTSMLSVSHQANFYRRLCVAASQRNWLHLGFLYLDDRPVAYNLGLIFHGTYSYLKTSYDYAERPLHPATFLRAKLLEELIASGVKYLDFPGEPYEWERQWTDEVQWHRSLILFGPSAMGRGYYVYRKARAFVRGDGDSSVAYVDPRASKPGPS